MTIQRMTVRGLWMTLLLSITLIGVPSDVSAQSAAGGDLLDLSTVAYDERFDFMLGTWKYEFNAGCGTARYERSDRTPVITEIVHGEFQGAPFVGMSLTVLTDPDGHTTQRIWNDSMGNEIRGRVSVRDVEMSNLPALVSEFELEGSRFQHIWYDISENRFETDLLVSQDDGETWQLIRRMPYIREAE